MADVNLTKADASTPAAATTTPHLSDLLAGPATDLLPGHMETAALHPASAATAHFPGLVDQRLMEEAERQRHQGSTPLI